MDWAAIACQNKFTQYAKSKYHIEIRSEVRKVANLLANRLSQKFNRLPQVWHGVLYLWAIANDARLDCYKRISSILNLKGKRYLKSF